MGANDKTRAVSAFISFGSSRTISAEALAFALQEQGIALAGWSEDEFRSASRVQDAINASTMFILLLAPGDEFSSYIQHETRLILQRCWNDGTCRVFAISDAVGGIPSGLRHQPFVFYFATSELNADKWSPNNVPTNFAEEAMRLLGGTTVESSRSTKPTEDQIKEWRNRVVHVVGSEGVDFEPAAKIRLLRGLRDDVKNGPPRSFDTNQALEWLQDRAVLASAVNEYDLAISYYALINQISQQGGRSAPPSPARYYNEGVNALEKGNYPAAVELFEIALDGFERERGGDDSNSIATRYNMGLSYNGMGYTDQAIETYQHAYRSALAKLGEHHPQTAAIATNLAIIYAEQGRATEARALLRQALSAYEATRPADSIDIARTRSRLESLEPVE